MVEVVTSYIEGDLSARERRRVESHLGACEGCAVYLDQMRQTIDSLGELREESLDPAARDGLMEAFRGWHAR
jgi:anti-sigma factor RsiW